MPQKFAKSFIQPSSSDVHVNRPLTNISIAYMQDLDMFVADQVFPNISVPKKSDVYYTYDRGHFNRSQMQERKPGTESAGINYEVANEPYYCKVYAIHNDVSDQVRANTDSPLDADSDATELVSRQGLLYKEINWVDNYFTTNVWTFEADGAASRSGSFDPTGTSANDVAYWSSGAASNPIEDVREAKRYVLESTGMRPNTLTMGRKVFDTLLDHPDVVGRLDRGQTTGPAIAARDSIAALFELDRILVMDAINNTAKEGLTNSHSFIAGNNALLTYSPSSPGLRTPSAGYTFMWTGFVGAEENGVRIKRFRMEALESDRIEAEMAWDQKVISADLGYFFRGIVQ